jgi:hypothetical protein
VATLLFIVEMFALYRWPKMSQLIAWLTLIGFAAYLGLKWYTG